MICPICSQSELIVKDDKYYCPSCKVYAGSAGSKMMHIKDELNRPIIFDDIKGSQSRDGVYVDIPLGIELVALLYNISGILLCLVFLILLMAYALINNIVSIDASFINPLTSSPSPLLLLIILPVVAYLFSMYYGFTHLRLWAFIIYTIVQISYFLYYIYVFLFLEMTSSLKLQTSVGFLLNILISIYIWYNYAHFKTKAASESEGMIYVNSIPWWTSLVIVGFLILVSKLILF